MKTRYLLIKAKISTNSNICFNLLDNVLGRVLRNRNEETFFILLKFHSVSSPIKQLYENIVSSFLLSEGQRKEW